MAHVGAWILSACLSSLPRVFQRLVLGVRTRLPYVELAPGDPALLAFTNELSKAIDHESRALARQGLEDPQIVEVHRLVRLHAGNGSAIEEAVSVSVRGDGRLRPLILHYPPEQRADAARALIRRLALRSATLH
jgi:hypothetical protein